MTNLLAMKFDFDDILIEPSVITHVNSRKQVDVFYPDGFLPLFTAPMDTVVSDSSKDFFLQNQIKVVMPRTSHVGDSENTQATLFRAYGIDEFREKFISQKKEGQHHVLIDIANGHMQKLLDLVKESKGLYKNDLILMVGNVAHPKTYRIFSEAGADLVRIGIGNGGGCLTTVQTGIGYPMASLIHECYQEKENLHSAAKIIADGGFKSYSDIIKALALGSDYVMLGSILNKSLESAGDTYLANTKKDGWTEPGEMINQYSAETQKLFSYGTKMFKKFRGMSTKEAQKSMGKEVLKTSEGVTRMQPVEYTVQGWTDNFKSYLGSAMSYCGSFSLDEFIGGVQWNIISQNSLFRFKK